MPITSNVAWDGRLKGFKGRDTMQYIETVKAAAACCAACRSPFGPEATLSLTVTITKGRNLGSLSSLSFDPALCHLQCQEPGLRVCEGDDPAAGVTSVGARMVLSGGALGRTGIPVLAYTLMPNIVMGEPGGEMTSLLVSVLLTHGFQMSVSANYTDILQRSVPAADTCICTVTEETVQFHVDGFIMCSQQLDRTDPNDANWLRSAGAGQVLIISGDNLMFTDSVLDLTAAASLGTLVTGIAPVQTGRPRSDDD